jgi:hypothetical protein
MEEKNYNHQNDNEKPKSFFFNNDDNVDIVKNFDAFLTEKNINQVKLFLPSLVKNEPVIRFELKIYPFDDHLLFCKYEDFEIKFLLDHINFHILYVHFTFKKLACFCYSISDADIRIKCHKPCDIYINDDVNPDVLSEHIDIIVRYIYSELSWEQCVDDITNPCTLK